jgi:hypothetical protein
MSLTIYVVDEQSTNAHLTKNMKNNKSENDRSIVLLVYFLIIYFVNLIYDYRIKS